MKRLLTTLVILTGLLGSSGAVWADAEDDSRKGGAAWRAVDPDADAVSGAGQADPEGVVALDSVGAMITGSCASAPTRRWPAA